MSAPAGDGPAPAGKRGGFGKVVARMKSVLKKSDGSKRLSLAAKPITAAAGTATAASTTAPSAGESSTARAVSATGPPVPSADTLPSTSTPTPAPIAATIAQDTPKPLADPVTAATPPEPRKLLRSEMEAIRAQRLAARFKIDILPSDWVHALVDNEEIYRIEKPIRMRIHRTCHRCSLTFGSTKTCMGCQHLRCAKCPRYPLKKSEKGKGVAREGVQGGLEVDDHYGMMDMETTPLTMPSKTGGPPLIRRRQMQRVRRFCCGCGELYVQGCKKCDGCEHVRCSDCPRDPAKKKKYPYGYPGDVPSANTKYYSCHMCTKVYPFLQKGDAPHECERCRHVTCEKCPPAVPRKVEPELDPKTVRSIEARMAAMGLRGTAAAAA